MIGCAAAAAMLVALPAVANDRDDDRGRGHHGGHHGGLADEVQELKERVSKLEGNLTREDVVGSYVFRSLQVALIANAQQPTVGRLEHLVAELNLQLNANGSFSLSGTETGFNAIWRFPTVRERVVRADNESGTWAYIGGVLHLTFGGGEVVPFGGAVGGRMFLRADSNPADGTTTLVLLVKRVAGQ